MAIKIKNNYTTTFSRSIICSFLITFLVVFGKVVTVNAQVNLHGVLQNYLAAQTTDDHDFIAARNRLRIHLDKPTDFGGLQTELDLLWA